MPPKVRIVYIAGKFSDRFRLREARSSLVALGGYEVCSPWLDEPAGQNATPSEKTDELALRDISEIEGADILILDTLSESLTGGREVEFGFALATGPLTYLVGPPRNIFHRLSTRQFESWEALIQYLRRQK